MKLTRTTPTKTPNIPETSIIRNPAKRLFQLIKNEIGAEVSDPSNIQEIEGMGYFNEWRDTVRGFLDDLKRDVAAIDAWVKHKYPEAFRRDQDVWPRKWMTANKQLSEALNERPRHNLIPLLNTLWRRRLDRSSCRRLMFDHDIPRHRNKGKRKTDHDLIFLDIDYKAIAEETDVSEAFVRKALDELAGCGIIRKHGKRSARGQMIFSMGYWSDYTDAGIQRSTAHPYLKKSPEMIKALMRFNIAKSKDRKQRHTLVGPKKKKAAVGFGRKRRKPDPKKFAMPFGRFRKLHTVDEETAYMIEYFLSTYQNRMGRKHPNLKFDEWKKTADSFTSVYESSSMIDESVINEYFDTSYTNRKVDYNIQHFNGDRNKDILLNRTK